MQNRSALWIFIVLLGLACLYQISFSFVTSSVKKEVEEEAKEMVENYADSVLRNHNRVVDPTELSRLETGYQTRKLRAMENEEVYPVLGHTYGECLDREMVLGLDLAGGMSVILEVKIPDLLQTFAANKKEDPTFKAVLVRADTLAANNDEKYIVNFAQAWEEVAPDAKMADIFSNREYKEMFGKDESNAVILEKLEAEAEKAIIGTEDKIRTRIDQFGVTQPTVTREDASGLIMVELPGVKDPVRVRKLLESTANLELWETYPIQEAFQVLGEINGELAREASPQLDSLLAIRATEDSIRIANDSIAAMALIDTVPVDSAGNIAVADDTVNNINVDDTTSADLSAVETAMLANEDAGIEPDSSSLGISDEELNEMANPIYSIFAPAIDFQTGTPFYTTGMLGSTNEENMEIIDSLLKMDIAKELIPSNMKLMWSAKPSENGAFSLYAIKTRPRTDKPFIDGSVITDASQGFDQVTGDVVVNMRMNGPGSDAWYKMTSENVGNLVAVTMDDRVFSAPIVNGPIGGGSTQITMGGKTSAKTILEAEDLARLLKAGSLPAEARIVDESIIGPSLGADNISSGVTSFIVAFILVLMYMIFYYGKAGVISNVALIANVFFLFGALASLQAALTLPGIAGIVLAIGMSVDANVLIFERIREEIRAGKGMRLAITDGYKRAYAAIIDANITTLLTAIVLFVFGTGPIKGFATTLMIGIFTSLFSAIFITRLIFIWQLERKKKISFATKMTKNAFTKVNIGFIKKRKMYYVVSALVVAAGIVSLSVRKLDPGVEFTGGRNYVVEFAEAADIDVVANALEAPMGGKKPGVKRIDEVTKLKISTNYRIKEEGIDNEMSELILTTLSEIDPSVQILSSRTVTPSISNSIQTSAMWSVIVALLVIFLYILFRFRRWQYGLGALAAIVHDVLVVLGLFSIFYGILPFSMEIDQAFIAAILTVVGYSINDTVVVFDRIREYLGLYPKKDEKEVVNNALNSTLSRTFNTSISTFLVLLIIFIFGGEAIKGFTFALMAGVVVGTYSSLFIATPISIDLSKKRETEV